MQLSEMTFVATQRFKLPDKEGNLKVFRPGDVCDEVHDLPDEQIRRLIGNNRVTPIAAGEFSPRPHRVPSEKLQRRNRRKGLDALDEAAKSGGRARRGKVADAQDTEPAPEPEPETAAAPADEPASEEPAGEREE